MRKHILLPILTVLLGFLGLIARQIQLRIGYDAAGLPLSGAVSLYPLITTGLFLLCAVLPLLVLKAETPPSTYDQAFLCENNVGYMMGTVFTAAGLICAAGFGCLAFVRHELPNALHLVLGLLMAASGVCLVLLGKSNYRNLKQGRYSACLLLPAYACALWLILAYQQCSGDPILQRYVYRLLAIIFILLAFYFMAGFSFEKGKPVRTVFASLCAVYFSLVTLLDDRNWMAVALLASFIIYFTIHSAVLLYNLTGRKRGN